jgi:hypothetical protein
MPPKPNDPKSGAVNGTITGILFKKVINDELTMNSQDNYPFKE